MKTIKQHLIDGAKHYEDHAAWERKRAEHCTKGSDVMYENMMAAKYNEGRAAAYREILEFLIGE